MLFRSEKQSLKQVFGRYTDFRCDFINMEHFRGTGQECRKFVQQLNLKRSESDHFEGGNEEMKSSETVVTQEDTDFPSKIQKPSIWSKYL